MKITNESNVPMAIAAWAVNDEYDYVNDPSYISVTSLLKPIRQIVLSRRVDYDTLTCDVEDYLARAMGTAIHDSVEKAWTKNYKKNLKLLGYADALIDKIRINPEKEEPNTIPIYLEQRNIKEFNGYKIGGKFDFVADGLLHDNKSTTVYKWTSGSSDEDYKLQGSLYRWLNQDKIKEDYIRINFVFTDWSKLDAMTKPDYPQHRALYKDIPLLSIEKTEEFLQKKTDLINKFMNTPEKDIPKCTDEELWREPTKYKYFVNPEAAKATKNFDNWMEAERYKTVTKGGKGVIRIVPGKVRRCKYCNAASICSQCKELFPNGLE